MFCCALFFHHVVFSVQGTDLDLAGLSVGELKVDFCVVCFVSEKKPLITRVLVWTVRVSFVGVAGLNEVCVPFTVQLTGLPFFKVSLLSLV